MHTECTYCGDDHPDCTPSPIEDCTECQNTGWVQGRWDDEAPGYRPVYDRAPCAHCRPDESRAYWENE